MSAVEARGGRVDMHHHAILPEYVRRLAEQGIGAQPGIDFPTWDPAMSIAMMDRLGIETAVLSSASPGYYFGDQDFATDLCRSTNDALASVVHDTPDRFLALAAVPLPSAEASVAEIERLLDVPGFAGVSLLTNYAGTYLGDPAFDALLERLDSLGCLVHVHPTLPPWWAQDAVPLRPSLLEYVYDTGRSLTNILMSGVQDRFPGIRWVFSHCGGVIPFIARRLEIAEPLPEFSRLGSRGVYDRLAEFRYDCALSSGDAGLGSLLSIVEPEHIVLGSDFPFVDEATVAEEMRRVDACAPVGGLAGLSRNGRRMLRSATSTVTLRGGHHAIGNGRDTEEDHE